MSAETTQNAAKIKKGKYECKVNGCGGNEKSQNLSQEIQKKLVKMGVRQEWRR